MTQKEWDLVHRFKSLVEEKLHVHQMIVFGSRARGDAEEESDLDVLVVIDEPVNRELRRFVSDCAFEVDVGNDFIVSPILVSRAEWENGPERFSPFAHAVREEGVPV